MIESIKDLRAAATPSPADRILLFQGGEPRQAALGALGSASRPGGAQFVKSADDLPAASAGVIELLEDTTYFFGQNIDLNGARLQASRNTVMIGGSSENCIISSTGLSASTPLVSSAYSLPMRFLALSHGTAIDLDATGNANQALDWFGVNFLNCATIGTIKNYGNAIFTSMAWLGSSGLTIDGTFGTVSMDNCLIQSFDGGDGVTVAATAEVTRRFRVVYSSVVAGSGSTGINVSTSATIPVESYILDTVNFSGAGTATAGVEYSDNKSLWTNCIGVNNSSRYGHMFMQDNATVTTISTTSTPVKAAGTTTQGATVERFSHTSNRLTYTGAVAGLFKVTVVSTFASTAGNEVGVYVAKNGTVVTDSQALGTANAAGRVENATSQTIIEMNENDYIEVFVENNSATNNVTVEALSVIIGAAI